MHLAQQPGERAAHRQQTPGGDRAGRGVLLVAADAHSRMLRLFEAGASETDGLDVTSADLGRAFARGLLVVQDGRNVAPPQRQNFKLVPWRAVERALALVPVAAE